MSPRCETPNDVGLEWQHGARPQIHDYRVGAKEAVANPEKAGEEEHHPRGERDTVDTITPKALKLEHRARNTNGDSEVTGTSDFSVV